MVIKLGYIRGEVANHQDYDVFSEIHLNSGRKINVSCCTTASSPSFKAWDPGKIEFHQYSQLKDLADKFDILDVSEFYRDYSQEILKNFKCKKTVTVFDNLPFGITDGKAGKLSQLANHVIARTPMIKRMLELERVSENIISVIPSAVNTNLFKPGIMTGQNPVVLFVGRLVPEKGLWDLILAMSDIKAELWVVSDINDSQRQYADLAYSCNTHIKFLGLIPHENLPKIMQNAAILVVPSIPKLDIYNPENSWVEQFGVVILEGMAAGLPILASDTGSVKDIMIDGETGYLFPPRSWDVLRTYIENLLASSGLRNKMGTYGRDRVKRLFSSEAVGKKLAEVYQSL